MSNLPTFLSQGNLEHNFEDQIIDFQSNKLLKLNKVSTHKLHRLPIKWSKPLSDYILSNVKGKTLQEQSFDFFEDDTLKMEFTRFKEVLLWYDENIKEKFQSSEEIFINCIRRGPSYADELADTLKYSIRKTLGIRMEDHLRDYPIISGRIDYIFDPKCLVDWDSNEPDDYLWLFKPPKKIEDPDLLDQILENLPVINLKQPDTIDFLKLFRKSKIFDSKKMKSIITFKDTISNPKWKSPQSLKFKRSVAHKYPDEKRDILICDHDTLRVILEASHYLKQIQDSFKEYVKDRSWVYQKLRKYDKKKCFYLMTDLKKSGLSVSRELVQKILKKIYERYHLECFNTLYNGFDNYWLYVNGNWQLTTEGKGLGLLDEIVCIGCMLLFKHFKGNNSFPEKTRGWFFNDDQLLIIPDELDYQLTGVLDNWNQGLQSIGYTVHGEKPWISKSAQYLEVYSPYCPINMEKSLRQYHIMVSNIRLPIMEAKSSFAQNWGRWWGLNEKDFNRALTFVTDYYQEFGDNKEIDYPYEIGGWWKFTREDKTNPLLVNILNNWDTIDKRYLNVLVKTKTPRIVTRWYTKLQQKIESVIKMKLINDDNMFSLKTRIEQLVDNLKLPTRYEAKYKQIYYSQLYFERQKAFKSKTLTKQQFIEFVKNKTWNNYNIPVELVYEGTIEPSYCYPIEHEYTPCDDVVRLYNSLIEQPNVRKPENGDITSIYRVLTDSQDNRYTGQGIVGLPNTDLVKKLTRFGSNIRILWDNLCKECHKVNILPVDINVPENEIPLFDTIDCSSTKSTITICFSGAIWKIDTDIIPEWVNTIKSGRTLSQNTEFCIKECIKRKWNPFDFDLFWQTLINKISQHNEQFLNKELIQPIVNLTDGKDEQIPIEEPFDYLNWQAKGVLLTVPLETGQVASHQEAINRFNLSGDIPELDDDPCGNLFGD